MANGEWRVGTAPTRYSQFAIRYSLLAIRHSLFAQFSPLRRLLLRRRRVRAAEDQPARVAIDILHHLVDLGERAPPVDREPLPFAQPAVGEAREPGRAGGR